MYKILTGKANARRRRNPRGDKMFSRKLFRFLAASAVVAVFTLAMWGLHHALRAYHYRDIVRGIREISGARISLAFILSVLAYVALTGYDYLAFRYIKNPLRYSRIAFASFLGYVFSHNLGGLSILGGGAVRYRLYSAWGLSAVEIVKVVVFCVTTFWLGFFTMAGIIFIAEPLIVPGRLSLVFDSTRSIGPVLLCLPAAFFLMVFFRKSPLKIGRWELELPSPGVALSQSAISAADWALSACVLYVLLPPSAAVSYPKFLGIYLLAVVMGLASHVPGGLGVFEIAAIYMLSPFAPAQSVFSAVVVYRLMYYLLPLTAASALFGIRELLAGRRQAEKALAAFGRMTSQLVPHALAISTFMGGAVLLFSRVTPAQKWRLEFLRGIFPLPVMEMSHLLASVAGAGLLILARGMELRLDASYFLGMILLASGAVFSVMKGLDYEEAAVLLVMLLALAPCRKYFYRRSSFLRERFSAEWTAAVAVVLAGSAWLAFFTFKHVEYSGALWWKFALWAHAPRAMRAEVGAAGVAVTFMLARLLRSSPAEPGRPGPGEMEKTLPVISASPRTSANLALLGDKSLLFSETGNSFIMYSVRGRAWVALGDPEGVEVEARELAWRFTEMADRNAGWPVFYEAGRNGVDVYLNLGLALLKIGEEARVPLADFSLEGGRRREFRHTLHKLEKEGYSFGIIAKERVPSMLQEFKRISDAWLEGKKTREKGFSLGFFNGDYLKYFPACAVFRSGRPLAFANLLSAAGREELSADLMRFIPGSHAGLMDYLFIKLMLWGKQQGYRWFNLGMAPLSGLEPGALFPAWSRLGDFLFRHGENLYNFQGVRRYKEKFEPVWEPRYLASPGKLALPAILADVAALISRGAGGILKK